MEASKNNFNNLPEEVILEIFSYLDVTAIRNCHLVCKNWDELISTSWRIMEKFQLSLSTFHNRPSYQHNCLITNLNEILSIRRIFLTMKFDSLIYNEAEIMKIVEVHGAFIKCLTINFCQMKSTVLNRVLNSMPNIETLFVSGTPMRSLSKIYPIESKTLKYLSISACNWKVFDYFLRCQVETLEIKVYMDGDRGHFENFLSKQTKIHTFSLNGYSKSIYRIFEQNAFESCSQLKLKKFSISNLHNESIKEVENNLLKFLKMNSNTIEEMNLNTQLSPAVYDAVLTKIHSLTKLKLDVCYIPHNKEFYESVRSKTKLKQLILTEPFKCNEAAKGLLGKFPTLEVLKMTSINPDLLMFLSINLQKLQQLSINKMPYAMMPIIKFSQLKSFHVEEVGDIKNWITFIVHNPTLTTLSIKELYMQQIDKRMVTTITNAKNLKHLKIQGGLKAMKTFFDLIKIDWNNIETMQLTVRNLNENFLRPFFIKFPKDKKYPAPECQYLDSFVEY